MQQHNTSNGVIKKIFNKPLDNPHNVCYNEYNKEGEVHNMSYYYYDYDKEIDAECKAQAKRWNGKVITTAKQWQYNSNGSVAVSSYSMDNIYAAYNEARESDYYMM